MSDPAIPSAPSGGSADATPILDAPVFLLSIPKAGTYYLSEILRLAGMHQTLRHVHDGGGFEDYASGSLEERRQNPGKFSQRQPMEQTLAEIAPGSFAVGHLSCNDENVALLARFKKLFVIRDVRTCLVSWMRWERETRRNRRYDPIWAADLDDCGQMLNFLSLNGSRLLRMMVAIQPWGQQPDVLTLRYEDLAGPEASAVVPSILAHLGLPPVEDPASLLAEAQAAETTTKSSRRSQVNAYWSQQTEILFKALQGHKLNEALGYPVEPPDYG